MILRRILKIKDSLRLNGSWSNIATMYSNELFQKVKEMQLPVGKYALFGSAPLAIRGIRECRDIDMIVSKDVWEEYKHKGWEMAVAPHGSEYLLRDEIEMWKDWYPGEWDVSDLIAKAEIIDGLPCVILDTVIEWKKLKGRDQDIRDIELIEEFLKK
ncbi:MAG: hypothetical protein UU43_C0004G0047 [Candidatus Falkowbacteria bacterium GW2011_GWA2_41_14]|uniref:Uncharacterized protein n=1 Tax=Candidatus Falkowbacteria bacterium GW2011_GWA2_41_14 TaxID=1618635 RepID=A0A0G0US76_9BACT|nr:MAG: hypothetical protein UU43_C0004G0047 [Candidatus Falkowbacteria bacterium GW2011_GWA2_41_14]